MYIESWKVYLDNIDKTGDVRQQCKTVLKSLSTKTDEFENWTYENINKGTITPHSSNIEWEGDRVLYSSSRYITEEVISELVAMCGNTTEVKKWLNNSDKGVELISYELYQTEDSN